MTGDIIQFKNWWRHYYKEVVLSVESYGRNVPKEQKVKFNVSSDTFPTSAPEQSKLMNILMVFRFTPISLAQE